MPAARLRTARPSSVRLITTVRSSAGRLVRVTSLLASSRLSSGESVP
jgi:hypothetical protein